MSFLPAVRKFGVERFLLLLLRCRAASEVGNAVADAARSERCADGGKGEGGGSQKFPKSFHKCSMTKNFRFIRLQFFAVRSIIESKFDLNGKGSLTAKDERKNFRAIFVAFFSLRPFGRRGNFLFTIFLLKRKIREVAAELACGSCHR